MPKCELCGESFSIRLKIGDKIKNLSHRKYCLKCSPFGKHNTRNLTKFSNPNRTCRMCGRPYNYSRKGSHNRDLCVNCQGTLYRRKVKRKAIEYKGGKCIICGYNNCDRNMSFHHIDPKTKDFQISGNHVLSWEKLKKELDKCVLLCCRCHGEVEDGLVKVPLTPINTDSTPVTPIFLTGT